MATSNAVGELESVEELKRQWLAMIDAIDEPLALISNDFSIARQNHAYFESAIGKGSASIRDLRGRKCFEVFAGRKSPCTHCKLPLALEKGHLETWTTLDLRPEKIIEVSAHTTKEGAAVVQYRDVTNLRIMQEELARNDKLAALGKLAGGVAHEINSPLAGILAFAQMALREMEVGNIHRKDMEEIEDAARKCKVIVEGLLGFARQEPPDIVAEFDVYSCVKSTLRLASPLLKKKGVQVEVHLEETGETVAQAPAMIKGNAGKISQVFLNLVTNALHAMDVGGYLLIQASTASGQVMVEIQDDGRGIEPSILPRIFDPFFTTKPVGEGTGLGLSICYSIVKQHGGEIRVQSQLGIGTTFTVVLPLAT